MTVSHKYKLSDRIIAFYGDNFNTNFGGAARRGTNNVFAKLKTSNLKMNIQGKRCAVPILHNVLHTSADKLAIDVEDIVNKIFQYFHIYTIRVEEWKEFCDFVDVEYEQILGSVKPKVVVTSTCNNQRYFHVSRIEVMFSFPRKMPDVAEKSV
jgi:hypothetical protein